MKKLILMMLVVVAMNMSGCASTSSTASTSSDPDLGPLTWMSGTWIGESGQSITEEHWTLPRGGTMLGVNRTFHDGKTVFFEYLRIEHRDDGTYYLASPQGRQPPTPFKLMQHTETKEKGRAVFENLENDFPQRIIYHREGDVMRASIEGMRNGRLAAEAWVWRRVE